MSEINGLIMKYFVLKPAGQSPYSKASRNAMRAYAESIRAENEELSDQLLKWCCIESGKGSEATP